MTLHRVYFVCRRCRLGAHPLDVRLGVTDSISHQAQRLLCLAGSSWSFDRAAQHLREFCGLSVSDNKIREVCQRHGAAAAAWQRDAADAHQDFRKATGDVEFSTDGTMVNTTNGWREMRIGFSQSVVAEKQPRQTTGASVNFHRRMDESPLRQSKKASVSARVGAGGAVAWELATLLRLRS